MSTNKCPNCKFWIWDAQACKLHSAVERSEKTGKPVKIDGVDGNSLVISFNPETEEIEVNNTIRSNISIWNGKGDCPDYVEVIS